MASPQDKQAAVFRRAAEALVDDVIQLAADLASIPSPTGDEGRRARFVADWWKTHGPSGLADPTIDDMQNVVAELNGRTNERPIVLAAHLDTVFAHDTPLNVRRDGDVVRGAGIGDNSLGTAALLMLPRLLHDIEISPAVSLVLAAPVGEEGLGNLRGMREVMSRYRHAGGAIAIEGHNVGRITATAVGSRRFRVTVTGPGGHSWGNYGRPSAIHVLGQIISRLADFSIPREPKTTFNVGHVDGGISINTIAPVSSMLVDLRSVDASILAGLSEQMEKQIRQFSNSEVGIEIELLGERPAGSVSQTSAIVEIAQSSLRALGLVPSLDASSTDANVPISMGIPAVCLGLTTGGNVHRPDEYIDVPPLAAGLAQLAMVAVNFADHLAGAP